MKAAWLSIPLWLAALACQSPSLHEVVATTDGPVAITVAIGGVT